MERGPIYIAGLERSGTSLIYALLASHPSIAMTRRTNLWTYFYNQYGDLSEPRNLDRCLAMMMRYKRVLVLKPDFDRLRRDFLQGEPSYGRLFALLEAQFAEAAGKPRWGDKSLDTERYADTIFATYPSARFLHMIRDPRDRYASARTRWKVSRGGVGAATSMWLWSVELASRNQERYPDRYKIMRYETLAARPEETLREICAFLGEDYDPAMLTFEGAKTFREKGSNSSYGPRDPGRISTNSIGRYRQILSKREIAFMQTYARQYMLAFDYSMEPLDFSAKDLLSALGSWPLNLARMGAWRAREAIQNRTGRSVPSYRIVADANSTVS